MNQIPFNKPFIAGKELDYIAEAVKNGHLSGRGPFTEKCCKWLEKKTGIKKALLVHSATAALEMSALLLDLEEGDEVILPSFTFVSTANAFALRGAKLVFVDIDPVTKNIDPTKIESAISERTKAIVPVHYAGVSCDMDAIMNIANKYKLLVIEDAAQGLCSDYRGNALGSIGHLACFSFHETKNFISGEGGALLINDEDFIERAEIILEKGTNRSQFFRGQTDKYTWVDIGSSYVASELTAAFLLAQFEQAEAISEKRMDIWNIYYEGLSKLENKGLIQLAKIPEELNHNAHIFYIMTSSLNERTALINFLKKNGVLAVFHYIPLHSSPMGSKFSKNSESLPVTDDVSERLLRLPCYFELSKKQQNYIIELIQKFYKS